MAVSPSPGLSCNFSRTALRLLTDDPPLARPRADAERLAEAHAWLAARALDRLAAWWPEGVDLPALRRVADRALVEAAATVARPEELPHAALDQIEDALRAHLRRGEWYAQATSRRLWSLCAAWRGALLVGRPPTDHLLCARLHLPIAELRLRFLEVALVFAIDPPALLPAGRGLAGALADTIAGLPADEQLVAALYVEECMTFDEIGKVMAAPAGHAQELLGRAATAIVSRAGLAAWAARVVSA